MALTCIDMGRLVQPYLDGEFSDEDRAAFDEHTCECTACRGMVQYEVQFKASLRAKLVPPKASSDLRTRILGRLDDADREQAAPSHWEWLFPGTAVAAAVGAIALFFVAPMGTARRASNPPSTPSLIAAAGIDHRVSPVTLHTSRPLAINPSNASEVLRRFESNVGVSMAPPQFTGYRASPRAVRKVRLQDRDVAQVIYEVTSADSRVAYDLSVLIFDPHGLTFRGTRRRTLGNTVVSYSSEGGYNSVYYRKNGVGYVVTSDVDEHTLLQLVAVELGH
jgi:anti-sigma factor RsiW